MDPISLVINVIRACDAVHTAVLQARCNQAQCALLDRRLQAIRPAIERVRTALETSHAGGKGTLTGDEQALVLSLISFDEVVRASRTCIESFTGDSWGQRAWKLINREGFAMEFNKLNDRITQSAVDLQLHFAALSHYLSAPATEALEEGVRLGNTNDRQTAANDDLKQLREQLGQIAEQVAAADEAAEQRAELVSNKLESAEEIAKRRHASVRSHLSQLESTLAVLLRQAQSQQQQQQQSPPPSLPGAVVPSKKGRQKLTAEDLQELEIPATDILLQEQIGSGGFGDVFRGLWISRDIQVAVKKLRISNLSAQAHSDLMREVTMLRRTRLPTVVALLGIVRTEQNKSFMLVLEYMNLGSLWDVLRKPLPARDDTDTTGSGTAADDEHRDDTNAAAAPKRGLPFGKTMSLEQRLRLMYQACLSVSHLHLSVPPIMHCDIKSLNFLLSSKGGSDSSGISLELKVADFGLSRTKRETTIQSTRADLTTTGNNPQGGSLMWKAPERFRGFGAFTFACDVYSLSIVLWEIATGDAPYAESSDDEIRANVRAGERMELPEGMYPPLAELITRMWAQDPKARPTAREAAQALANMRRAVMAEAKKAAGSNLPSPSASSVTVTSPTSLLQGSSVFSFSTPVTGLSASASKANSSNSSSSSSATATLSVVSTSSTASSISQPGAPVSETTMVTPFLSPSPPTKGRRRQQKEGAAADSSVDNSSSEPGAVLKSPRRRRNQLSVSAGDAPMSVQQSSGGLAVPAPRPGDGSSTIVVLEADDLVAGPSSESFLAVPDASSAASSLPPPRRDWSVAYASSGEYAYTCTALWGSTGDLESDLAQPAMISFDSAAQQLLLVDAQQRNEQVQIWSASGSALQRWGRMYPAAPSGVDDLQQPAGVVQDSAAKLCFVSDAAAGEIRVYSNETGELLRQFGRNEEWPEAQRLYCPTQLVVDPSRQHVFVVEFYAHRVQCFTYEGVFVTCWGGQMALSNTSLKANGKAKLNAVDEEAAATATADVRGGRNDTTAAAAPIVGEKLFRGPSGIAILPACPAVQRHSSDVNRAQSMLFVGDSTGVVQIFSAERTRGTVKLGSLRGAARSSEKIASIAVVASADQSSSSSSSPAAAGPNATMLVLDSSGTLRMLLRNGGAPRRGPGMAASSQTEEEDRWSCIRQFPLEARIVTLDAETGRIYTLNEIAVRIEVFDLQRMRAGTGKSNQMATATDSSCSVGQPSNAPSSSSSSSSLELSKPRSALAQKLLEYATSSQESPLSPMSPVKVQLRGNHPAARAASLSRSPSNAALSLGGVTAAAAAELPEWRSDSQLTNGQFDYFTRALFACRGSAGGETPGVPHTPERIRLASPVCMTLQPSFSSLVAIVDPANKRTAVMATNGAGCIMLAASSSKRSTPIPVGAGWAYNAPNLLFVLAMQQQPAQSEGGSSGWYPLLQLWKCGSSSGSLQVSQKLDGWSWPRDALSALAHGVNTCVVPTIPCSFAVHPTDELVSVVDYAAGVMRIHRMDGSLQLTCSIAPSPSLALATVAATGATLSKACGVLAVSGHVMLLLLEDGRVRTMRWTGEVLAELHCSDLLQASSDAVATEANTKPGASAAAVSFTTPRSDAFPSGFMSLSSCSPPLSEDSGVGPSGIFVALVFLPRVRLAGLLEVRAQGRTLRWIVGLPLPRDTLCVGFSCARGTLMTVQRTEKREMRAISWALGPRQAGGSAEAGTAGRGNDGGETASSIRPIVIAASAATTTTTGSHDGITMTAFPRDTLSFSSSPSFSSGSSGTTSLPASGSSAAPPHRRRRLRGGGDSNNSSGNEYSSQNYSLSLASSTQQLLLSSSTTQAVNVAMEAAAPSIVEASVSHSADSKSSATSRRRGRKSDTNPSPPAHTIASHPPGSGAVAAAQPAAKPSRRQKKAAEAIVSVREETNFPLIHPSPAETCAVQPPSVPGPTVLPVLPAAAASPSAVQPATSAGPASSRTPRRGLKSMSTTAELQSREEAGFNRPAVWLQAPSQLVLPAIGDEAAAADSDTPVVEAASSLNPQPPQTGRRARRQRQLRQTQQEAAPIQKAKELASADTAADSSVYAGGARDRVAKRNQDQAKLDQEAKAKGSAGSVAAAVGVGVVATGGLFAAGMRLHPDSVKQSMFETVKSDLAQPAASAISDGAHSLFDGVAGGARSVAHSSVVNAVGDIGSAAVAGIKHEGQSLFGPGGVTAAGIRAAHGVVTGAGSALSAVEHSALLQHARNGALSAFAGGKAGLEQCVVQ